MEVPWSDGRQDAATRGEHALRTRRLHQVDSGYHRAAVHGLAKGRAQRAWTDDAILQAVRKFRVRNWSMARAA